MKKTVFANIESERIKAGMSKKEIAAKLGITPRTYYNYTHGIVPIPSSVLVKCSRLFQCSADYLLNDSA